MEYSTNEIGISIITIVLNGQDQIAQTIESVISQKTIPIEYIVIDGISSDNTLNVINRFKDKIDFILSEKDSGIYDAINKGIAIAKFPLIGIIHCGDFYSDGILLEVFEAYKKTNADVIYGDIEILQEIEGETISKYSLRADHTKLQEKMSIFHPSTFIKKSCYVKNGYYNTEYKCVSDYDLILGLFLNKYNFLYLQKVIATFRLGGLSSTNDMLLVLENFLLRMDRFGFVKAFRYLFRNAAKSFYYILRRRVFIYIFGKKRYLSTKKVKQFRSEPH